VLPTQSVPVTPSSATPTPDQVRAAQKPAAPPAPPAVKAEAQVAAVPPAATAPISGKAFKIQLGAVRTEAAARVEWDKLKKSFPSVLGRLSLNVEKADLGQKGIYFRIQAGPFNDRSAADAACAELTKQKTPCLAIRPEG
jgi:cell division septation protein DedD